MSIISKIKRFFNFPSSDRFTQSELQDELDKWKIITLDDKELGKEYIIRIRIEKPKVENISDLQIAITINWPYQSDTSFPNSIDNEQTIKFEEAIDELTSMNGHTELVQVVTGMGNKEWLFYTERFRLFFK